MPGATSFYDVRKRYDSMQSDLAIFTHELQLLRAKVTACETLLREHITLVDEYQTLDARALEHTRRRMVEHLLSADASQVTQHLRTHAKSALLLLFLRASGVTAKIAYLDQMLQVKLTEMRQDADVQLQKLNAAEARTRKRWAPMLRDKFDKLAQDRRPRHEQRWQRLQRTYSAVSSYDRYDRGRYYEQFLWWDLMTRGRYDGSYIDEVSAFHHANPSYAFEPDWKRVQEEQREAASADDAYPGDAHKDATLHGYGSDDRLNHADSNGSDVEAEAAAAELDETSATADDVDTTTTDAS